MYKLVFNIARYDPVCLCRVWETTGPPDLLVCLLACFCSRISLTMDGKYVPSKWVRELYFLSSLVFLVSLLEPWRPR